jgi:hypothetical protein
MALFFSENVANFIYLETTQKNRDYNFSTKKFFSVNFYESFNAGLRIYKNSCSWNSTMSRSV